MQFNPDLVIVDYIGEMKDYPGMPTWESRQKMTRDLRGFAVEEKICLLTAMQPNRSGKEAVKAGLLIDDENLSDSYGQVRPLDAMWTINQTIVERGCGVARIFIAKHRDGESRKQFYVQFNMKNLKIDQISEERYLAITKEYGLKLKKMATDKVTEEAEVDKVINSGHEKPVAGDFGNDVHYNNEDSE